jgi:hypothetical protein
MIRFSAAILLLVVLWSGCSRETDPALQFDPGLVLATVNGEPVHEELFEETYVNFLSRTGFADTPRQRYFHLNTIIDMFLLDEEATRRGLADAEREAYVHRTRMRTLRNLFLKNQFMENLEMPGDPETRLAFYRSKQRPYVRQLFFFDDNQANEYYARLQGGEDFVDLANELYRTAEYDSLAGFLGEISYFGVDDVFAETAYTLNAGEYSEPVRTRQGFVIIRVDNWNFNPIVTETEYVDQREKTQFFLYQRNYAIGADEFVRGYMSGLEPQPQLDNLQQVHRVLQRNLPRPEDVSFLNQPVMRGDRIGGMGALDPMMPLVTYTIDGQLQAFRLQDYLLWIDALPYQEVMGRFDASVGRALMWDVFAKQSVALGYERNPFVDFNAGAAVRFYQASRLQERLRSEPPRAIEEQDLHTAFEMFGMNTLRANRVSYWVVNAGEYLSAREIRDRITADPDAMLQVPGGEMVRGGDVGDRHPHLASHLLRAVPDMPFITGTGTDWYVIIVFDRELEFHTLDTRREEVAELIRPSYNEFTLLRELRDRAAIRVDSVSFERLMDYYPG